jgi:hypothetical protein
MGLARNTSQPVCLVADFTPETNAAARVIQFEKPGGRFVP